MVRLGKWWWVILLMILFGFYFAVVAFILWRYDLRTLMPKGATILLEQSSRLERGGNE
jgi:hypothetical protein